MRRTGFKIKDFFLYLAQTTFFIICFKHWLCYCRNLAKDYILVLIFNTIIIEIKRLKWPVHDLQRRCLQNLVYLAVCVIVQKTSSLFIVTIALARECVNTLQNMLKCIVNKDTSFCYIACHFTSRVYTLTNGMSIQRYVMRWPRLGILVNFG